MQQPPIPEPRDLLPPLLACLPTTFLSSRPPPALISLLAPTLRQRLNYLASSGSDRDGWVRLLNWDTQQAAKLPAIVENLDLEPHPVSGEVEIDDVRAIKYQRLDDETLHARLEVEQFDLLPIYVWCENDEHGEAGPGWLLTELKSLEDKADGTTWHSTVAEANDASAQQNTSSPESQPDRRPSKAETEDDDYWASYDQAPSETPVPTPGPKRSPAPQLTIAQRPSARQEEDDYYARYGAEVQPALDAQDPDEELAEAGESTLHGTQERGRPVADVDDRPEWERALYPHTSKFLAPHDSAVATSLSQSMHSELNMPRPISPASSSRSVERLEEQAAAMSDTSTNSRIELGIKQHISTDIKSLFRLAKSAGMNRTDFENLVKRELDVLSMLDDE